MVAPRKRPPKAPAVKTAKAAKAEAGRQGQAQDGAKPRRPPSRRPSPHRRPPLQPVAVAAPAGRGGRARRPLRCGDRAGRATMRLSAEDAASLREAIAAAAGGKLPDAKALRDKITDPAARKLVDWYLYRGGYGTASEIRAFLDANPAWPDRGLLTQRAEEALFNSAAERRARSRPSSPTPQPRDRRRPSPRWRSRLSRRQGRGEGQGAGAEGLDRARHAGEPRAGLPQARRLPAHRGRPQAPPRPAAVQRQPLDRRAQRARRRHPPRDRRCCPRTRRRRRRRVSPSSCAPRTRRSSSPSCRRTTRADWGLAVQRAQALRRQKKEEEAWKILLAEPEHGRPGQARRLVGGAARQRLCGAQARQAQDGLRAGAQSRPALRQRRQGRGLPRGLAGAAPPARHQAGARPFRGAGQGRRRPAEPCARPLLARPHARGARRQGQGAGALPGRFRLLRHLPRPARPAQGRRRRARPQDRPAGRTHARRRSPASTAPMRSGPP